MGDKINNDLKKDTKKVVIISIVGVILSMIAVVGVVSYAYFNVIPNINDPDNKREAIVTTNYLDFDFETTRYIDNDNLVLVKPDNVATDSEKIIFTITKKDNVDYAIRYNIYMTDFVISDNLKSVDFKWDLLENGTSIYSGTFSNAISGSDYLFTTGPILLNDKSASYELRVWIEETSADQSGLYNGNFSGKLEITATSVVR
ncbi:MAG: hypothetical protein ACI31M_01355 [Bacilli bacterium]